MKTSLKAPQKGFYYHYKHDPKGTLNNYSYEVLGVSRHTETEEYGVMYRPLYKNTYLAGADFSIRPLGMFNGDVEKDGITVPRFVKITDQKVIDELEKIRDEMYPEII